MTRRIDSSLPPQPQRGSEVDSGPTKVTGRLELFPDDGPKATKPTKRSPPPLKVPLRGAGFPTTAAVLSGLIATAAGTAMGMGVLALGGVVTTHLAPLGVYNFLEVGLPAWLTAAGGIFGLTLLGKAQAFATVVAQAPKPQKPPGLFRRIIRTIDDWTLGLSKYVATTKEAYCNLRAARLRHSARGLALSKRFGRSALDVGYAAGHIMGAVVGGMQGMSCAYQFTQPLLGTASFPAVVGASVLGMGIGMMLGRYATGAVSAATNFVFGLLRGQTSGTAKQAKASRK